MAMKLKFDSNLEYQSEAIQSVVDLFTGQTAKQALFSVANNYTSDVDGQIGMGGATASYTLGVGNKLELTDDEMLENIQAIQLRNGLPQTTAINLKNIDYKVEMETGTGKTYVYLRTIMELHKNYGFTKFIIVVPSIAIKEGVYKTLQITDDHFHNIYNNVVYDYFIYNSKSLSEVRDFAVNDNISIMVINIDSFRQQSEDTGNIIYRANDSQLSGAIPIELIQSTNPIVFIDEPQSVVSTELSRNAIAKLNPLCTIQYSATLPDKNNLVYKLDAVDAFNMHLVKGIEVTSFSSEGTHNLPYIKLVSVTSVKSKITAKLELDCEDKGKIKRKTVTVKFSDKLNEITGRDIYDNLIVDEISCRPGDEYISFTPTNLTIKLGEHVGDVDDLTIKEQQIRATIEEHLNKELRLHDKGIKVLSLFFLDRVANYRDYDDAGNRKNGPYAEIFEREYLELIKKPKYKPLLDCGYLTESIDGVHDGYFSIDKKSKREKDTDGTTSLDEDTFSRIMKEKEKLLSFDDKLRFIFSHSALKEGWDNPNVFQICTLNASSKSEMKKRQEIGRGLRLCVNQDGERILDESTNILTVMANESYQDFAEKLQKEYEKDTGIRFGLIESHTFANMTVTDETGHSKYLGQEKSAEIVKFFADKGYIDNAGYVTDVIRQDLKANQLQLPEEFEEVKEQIAAICKKVCGNLNVKPSKERVKVNLNEKYFSGEKAELFKGIWDQIKYKTTYSVDFDSDELIEKCVKHLKEMSISKMTLTKHTGKITLNEAGIETAEISTRTVDYIEQKANIPDIITILQDRTNLTRKTIVEILIQSDTLEMFKKNPQSYMETVAQEIKGVMEEMIVDGIKYTKVPNGECYEQEKFNIEELYGYKDFNMIAASKSLYDSIVFDSNIEKEFAERLEANNVIYFFVKLPAWFTIDTPLGKYNPDWAIVANKDGEKKLYFIVETKGNVFRRSLKGTEYDKIRCGKRHFEALDDIQFLPVDNFDDFIHDGEI